MLETYGSQQSVLYEERSQSPDFSYYLSYFIGILKRRFWYFVIPFSLIATLGYVVIKIQRPIYRAEGKILIEAPAIPPDLVRPTVSEVVDQGIAILKQRVTARDNLIAVMNKYNLFPNERKLLSATQLIDLMRARIELKPLQLELAQPNSPTIAFTLSFEYEDPNLATNVTSEFLTEILNDDASRRTSNATETTKFLESEVKRLQGEHDAIVVRIEALQDRPPDPQQTVSDEVKVQRKSLADLEADLVQKSSVYSDEHPIVKDLKRKIAALKRAIAAAPQATAATDKDEKTDVVAEILKQQQLSLEKSLDDANSKLTVARLGETLERNQQAQHLRLIEQPVVPLSPVRPKKFKWFAMAIGLAGMIGGASVVAAEMLDRSIRTTRDLAGIVDGNLIVTIPYVSTPDEERRKRRKLVLLWATLVVVLLAAIVFADLSQTSIDFAGLGQYWMNTLTRLSH